MRRWVYIVIATLLLAAGIVLCAFRWQAWFGMPDEPVWTGETLSRTYPTFADDSVPGFVSTSAGWLDTISPDTLNILLLGDIHNRLCRDDYDSLAARVPNAEIVAQVGDWLDRGYNYYYQRFLREYAPTPLSLLPVINCPGNHEYTKGLRRHVAEQWPDWFPQAKNGPVVPGETYYVDFPNLRFIVIDTNPLDRLVYLTRTLTWLRQAMYTADDRFVVVLMHHPVLPAGKNRFCPLIYATFRYPLSQADLVICGHDHSYMRHTPFVVLNSAGQLKPQQQIYSTDCASAEPAYGVLTIDDSTLNLTIHRTSDGTLIDSLHVTHD